jgi:hypothetical protein
VIPGALSVKPLRHRAPLTVKGRHRGSKLAAPVEAQPLYQRRGEDGCSVVGRERARTGS